MKSTLKKWISVLLALVLVVQLLPTSAFATDGDDEIIIIDGEEILDEQGEDSADAEITLINETEEFDLIDDWGTARDVAAAYVVGEVEELRGANEKHFRLSDGSFAALSYEETVHFLDENGEWQEIDNSLQQDGSDYLARAGRRG